MKNPNLAVRAMTECEAVENRIEEMRYIAAISDSLNRAQRNQIEAVLDNLERACACLCPQEPAPVPPGLEDFQL